MLAPRRSEGAQRRRDPLALGAGEQLAERFQERQVGLTRAELLEAPSAGDHQAPIVPDGTRQDLVEQAGLADAGRARHTDHAAAPGLRPREPPRDELELAPAADERFDLASRGLRGRFGRSAWVGRSPHEAVATPGQRLNVARRARALAERLAQSADRDRQVVLQHDRVGPEALEELRFGEPPFALADEQHEELRRLRGERHELFAFPQDAGA